MNESAKFIEVFPCVAEKFISLSPLERLMKDPLLLQLKRDPARDFWDLMHRLESIFTDKKARIAYLLEKSFAGKDVTKDDIFIELLPQAVEDFLKQKITGEAAVKFMADRLPIMEWQDIDSFPWSLRVLTALSQESTRKLAAFYALLQVFPANFNEIFSSNFGVHTGTSRFNPRFFLMMPEVAYNLLWPAFFASAQPHLDQLWERYRLCDTVWQRAELLQESIGIVPNEWWDNLTGYDVETSWDVFRTHVCEILGGPHQQDRDACVHVLRLGKMMFDKFFYLQRWGRAQLCAIGPKS